MSDQIKLNDSWKALLLDEFNKPYFKQLKQFLLEEKAKGYTIYPPGPQIFAALDKTPFDQVKVVLLGQDPYHGAGQAHGLCFSVNDGISFPPSLHNIFKELKDDCGCDIPASGNLSKWADQGVLLLNATLTVRANEAGSHQNKGWEILLLNATLTVRANEAGSHQNKGWEMFTDHVIQTISAEKEHVVFMLWGRYAQGKIPLIDASKHLVLTAAHPSPLARGAFFGSKHFSRCNQYLTANGHTAINWQL